jgi:hypothetical protein
MLSKAVQWIAMAIFLLVMFYQLKTVPWAHLLTWRALYFVLICFVTYWLFARFDHGARLLDVVTDIPNLLVGMLFSAMILYLVYFLLKPMFEPG